jgi:phospholipid/cholesterol/gamma-HCH transport system substrate-binding protein
VKKDAVTPARIAAMTAFATSCFALLLYLWVSFGGTIPLKPNGYRLTATFDEATLLGVQAEVQISGVTVGKVRATEPTPDGRRVLATFELDRKLAPLPADSKAMLRQKTLLGETYIELTPGTAGGRVLAEGAEIPQTQVSPTVQLDEIFRAFDRKTRTSFQVWLQSMAEAGQGRGADVNDAFGSLPAFASDTSRLLEILNSQEGAVQQTVSDTGEVFGALTERGDQLAALLRNSRAVTDTLGRRSEQFADAFRALPRFEREGKALIDRVNLFQKVADPAIEQLRPAFRELGPTGRSLARVAPELEGLIRGLGPLITASEDGLPAADRTVEQVRRLLGQLDPFLRSFNPVFRLLNDYRREFVAFVVNATAASQAGSKSTDGKNSYKYFRGAPALNPEMLAVYDKRLNNNRSAVYGPPGINTAPDDERLRTWAGAGCKTGPGPKLAPEGVGAPLDAELRKLIQTYALDGAEAAPDCAYGPQKPYGPKGANYPDSRTFPYLLPDLPPATGKGKSDGG